MAGKPKESRHYRFRNLEFWAEGGLVRMIDVKLAEDSDNPGEKYFKSIPPAEFIKRAIAARVFIGDRPDQAFEGRQFLDNAVRVAKEAKRQGDPTDPEVQQWTIRHKAGRKVQILQPGASWRFRKDDPESILRNGVQLEPNLLLPR